MLTVEEGRNTRRKDGSFLQVGKVAVITGSIASVRIKCPWNKVIIVDLLGTIERLGWK